MKERINVAIIGAGSISEEHIKGYQALPQVQVIAVCDLDEEKAKAYAEKHNIPQIFTDYHELLKLEELDAVSVTTWNNSHGPISIAAMKAGKDVLCEKPLAMNAKEAQEMVDVAKETGRLLMVGFVRRFETQAAYMKEVIERKKLGQIYYGKTGYLRKWGNPGGWFCDKRRSGGGPVIDLGVHVIDLIRYLTGKPKAVSVSATTSHHYGLKPHMKGLEKYNCSDYDPDNNICDVEDSAVALIQFDNGMTLSFETSWVLPLREDLNYLELFGDKAGVKMEPELEFYTEEQGYYITEKPVIETSNEFSHIFGREIAHFVECITDGVDCLNPAEDGVEIMKIVDAIYQSAATKSEVII